MTQKDDCEAQVRECQITIKQLKLDLVARLAEYNRTPERLAWASASRAVAKASKHLDDASKRRASKEAISECENMLRQCKSRRKECEKICKEVKKKSKEWASVVSVRREIKVAKSILKQADEDLADVSHGQMLLDTGGHGMLES